MAAEMEERLSGTNDINEIKIEYPENTDIILQVELRMKDERLPITKKSKQVFDLNKQCKKCNHIAINRKVLSKHMVAIHKVVFSKCEQCDYTTKHKGNLNTHIKAKHVRQIYKCLHCDFITSSKQYQQKHIQEKHDGKTVYFCSDCDFSSENKEKYQLHIRTDHQVDIRTNHGKSKKPVQTKCLSKIRKRGRKHTKTAQKQFLCESCDYSTDVRTALNRHTRAVHIGSFDFFCDSCDFTTTAKHYLWRHFNKHHKDLDRSRPYPLLTPIDEIPDHRFITNCQTPKLLIDGFVLKMNKYRYTHQGEKCAYFYCINKNKYKCKVSGKALEKQTDIKKTAMSPSVFIAEGVVKEGGEETILKLISYQGKHVDECTQMLVGECKVKRGAKSNKYLEGMIVTNLDTFNLKCDLCEYVATSNNKLHEHRGESHGLTDFSCDQCDFQTHLINRFKIHKRDKHIGRSHPCSFCKHISTSIAHLKTHIQNVHEDISYPCENCEKKYKQSYMLKIHNDTVHYGFVHKCSHCSYISKQKGHMNHHIKTIHLGQRYKCEDCGKEFNHRNNLEDHKKYNHGPPGLIKKTKKNRKRSILKPKDKQCREYAGNITDQKKSKPIAKITESEHIIIKTEDKESNKTEYYIELHEKGFIVETVFSKELNGQKMIKKTEKL